MDTTITGIGAVAVAELRSAGYMESTIGQYEKSIKVLGNIGSQKVLPGAVRCVGQFQRKSPHEESLETI